MQEDDGEELLEPVHGSAGLPDVRVCVGVYAPCAMWDSAGGASLMPESRWGLWNMIRVRRVRRIRVCVARNAFRNSVSG
eukprot:170443-Alexandrium_andersonii.AAC.1